MKKHILLAAPLLALAAQAAEPSSTTSVYTAKNNPEMGAGEAEVNTITARGISTLMPAEPFLSVHHRYEEGARKIMEQTERGEIRRGVTLDELTATSTGSASGVQEDGPPEPPTPDESLTSSPVPKAHVLTPGVPLQRARTLAEAQQVQGSEYHLPSPPAESAEGPSAAPMAPVISRPVVEEVDVATSQKDSGVLVEEGYVVFEVLNPKTWGPSFKAYILPQGGPFLLPGALTAFVVAFMLGRSKRRPGLGK